MYKHVFDESAEKTKMTSLGVRGRVWNDGIEFGGKR